MRENRPDYVPGRRIVVWGMTGSGKTTLSRRLGSALGLGVIELDSIRHANGWDSTDWDDFRARLTERMASHPEGWVCEGSYSRIMQTYLPEADTLIWLHLPLRVSFWRLLRRTLKRAWTQEPVYEGSPARESFRKAFLSRESLLLWSISHHRAGVKTVRGRVEALPPPVRVYELRSASEVEALALAAEQAASSVR